jgi:hypothetical protein
MMRQYFLANPRSFRLQVSLTLKYLLSILLPQLHLVLVQSLTSTPDLDRVVGRAFLGRASPNEFVQAMSAFASLPEKLLSAEKAADSGHAALLQSSLLSSCSPQVRAPDRLLFPSLPPCQSQFHLVCKD